jgi:RNA polymerase sigma-70 factor (ECF subfamily)
MSAPRVALDALPLGALDEAGLVLRIRAGDESACESLYRAYRAPLWRFAYGYVRSREIAEELVQEIFLALWRNRAEAGPNGGIRAWLYAAVRNQALNHLRHERIVTRLGARTKGTSDAIGTSGVESTVAMGAPAPDAHSAVEASELDDAVMRAIAALPERRRIAMTLRWKHDLPPAEIARVLGTTPEAVRVLLTRARHDLASLLALREAR